MTLGNALTTAKRIRRQASKGYRHEQVQLQVALTPTDTTITLTATLPKGLIVGTTIGADLELMLVTSISTATNQCNVIRGYQDTVAVAHAINSLADIAPRFTVVDIFDAMRAEIGSWGNTLYRVVHQEFTVAYAAQTVELPVGWVGFLGVVEVVQSELGTISTVWPRLPAKLVRGDNTGYFTGAPTSGLLLRFTEPIRTGQVLVTAAIPFLPTDITITNDLIVDLSLTVGMIDVLEMGVKRRLMMDELSSKGARHAQDETRLAVETPIGSLVPMGQLQLAQYTHRLQTEANRLHRQFPIRIQ